MWVKGTIYQNSSAQPDGGDFIIKNSAGTVKAWINNDNGDLYLVGEYILYQSSITPSSDNDFIIKNASTENVVAMVDTSTGNLYRLGAMFIG